jgi:hypothetical protein
MNKTNTRQKTQARAKSSASREVSTVAVTAVSITAGLIGIWAVACMVAGVLNTGGPVALVSNLFKAIFG